ncbi:MAG: heme biosynthesis HemY N-terminal domain-containing protein [Woeseiaceae bacterium]|nr:heme biosynthesis HemY N-terminal domain-containing protein [Woeseiaceae bacterium]
MKFGAIVVVVLVLSAVAAHFLLGDPGYVAITFRGYLIEMSVPVLVGLAVLLIIVVWLIRRIIQAPRLIGEAAGRYRSGRAGIKLTRGMIEVAEGNFARGEKLLARAASTSDAPLFNYLQAARAAHLQGKDQRRDEWLKLAYEHTPEAANAVLLTQAEFQLDQEQYEQALATLRRIEENSKDHSHALALLARLYFRLEDWANLAQILPRLEKQGRVKPETLDEWAVRVRTENLANAADGAAVAAEWKSVPKRLKSEIAVLEAYYKALMRVGQHEQAERELAAALKADWRAPLVRLYGRVEGPDPTKQLNRAERWLAKRGEDADLLLAAARLCLRNELWGKARSYLETVIALRPTPSAYQEYGRLLTQLGETDAAADAYRDGLGMAARSSLRAIPHLDPDQA